MPDGSTIDALAELRRRFDERAETAEMEGERLIEQLRIEVVSGASAKATELKYQLQEKEARRVVWDEASDVVRKYIDELNDVRE